MAYFIALDENPDYFLVVKWLRNDGLVLRLFCFNKIRK